MIKYPLKIRELLKLLAFQVGSQVSVHELGIRLGLNRDTVERYLFLLEQSFVIFKLPAFSRNPRKEISKSQKYYFYDTGIRKVLIDNMKPLADRNDTGALWENFLISERFKFIGNNELDVKSWFWRTTQQQEIDYIEEYPDKILAWEFKWNSQKTVRLSKTFANAYSNTEFNMVNPENIQEFLLK